MLITGLSISEFAGIVRGISESRYDGNVIMAPGTREFSATRFRACLRTVTGRGAGARTSCTGKHYPVTCWHAYRDIMAEVFRQFPDARIEAGVQWHVVYRGADDFAEKYPATGNANIGSQMQPVTMPELCECEDDEPRSPLRYDSEDNYWELEASRSPEFVA